MSSSVLANNPLAQFLLPLLAAGGEQKENKKFFGDTPSPGKGLAALCSPAENTKAPFLLQYPNTL